MRMRRASGLSQLPGGSQSSQLYDSVCAKSRYVAFSRLQATAVQIGETLPIPEIVAVGGQSDGKSSLMEALLGFRFNIRATEMGTRRPLVVQMVHDPDAATPRCRLQDEDAETYGPVIEPETQVCDAIRERTQEWLKRMGGVPVHSKPIVMRAESAHCPNLTIIDTPGFILKARQGEPESTPDEIRNMVVELLRPRHRIILFLQQASVEWCSSLWLDVVKEVDPELRRTIMVASKFDNRMREFHARSEVDAYLSARGYLPPHVHPFFVALPQDRSALPTEEFREQVRQTDAEVRAYLRGQVEGGFDEGRFGPLVGFANLRAYLEDELAIRYQEAAPSVLAALRDRISAAQEEVGALEEKASRAEDPVKAREAALEFTSAVARHVLALMDGDARPDPGQHGLTSEEEVGAIGREVKGRGFDGWPRETWEAEETCAGLRLHSGAAFERCLRELESAALTLSVPDLSEEEVATAVLTKKGALAPAGSHLARVLVRRLQPFLHAACARLAATVRRALPLALLRMEAEGEGSDVTPYSGVHAEVRSAFNAFVDALRGQAQRHLDHQLDVLSSPYSSMAHTLPVESDEAAAPGTTTPEEDKENAVAVSETPQPQVATKRARARGRRSELEPVQDADKAADDATDDAPVRVGKKRGRDAKLGSGASTASGARAMAGKVFKGMREELLGRMVPATLRECFLRGLGEGLSVALARTVLCRADGEVSGMMGGAKAVAAVREKAEEARRRLGVLERTAADFEEMAGLL